jgi:hypothetical protein
MRDARSDLRLPLRGGTADGFFLRARDVRVLEGGGGQGIAAKEAGATEVHASAVAFPAVTG